MSRRGWQRGKRRTKTNRINCGRGQRLRREREREEQDRQLQLTQHDIEALRAITNSPVAYVRQAAFEKFVSEADILNSGTVGLFREDTEAR